MEQQKVTPIMAFNFVNAEGNKMTLTLGVENKEAGNGRSVGSMMFWKVFGNKVPFPVQCGTWFIGLPARAMETSLNNLGYWMYAKVYLNSGRVDSYEVNFGEREENRRAQWSAVWHAIGVFLSQGNEEEARKLHDLYIDKANDRQSPSFAYMVRTYEEIAEGNQEMLNKLIIAIRTLYKLDMIDIAQAVMDVYNKVNDSIDLIEQHTEDLEKGSMKMISSHMALENLNKPEIEKYAKFLSQSGMGKLSIIRELRDLTGASSVTCRDYLTNLVL